MSHKIQKYGWRKDKLDQRDHKLLECHISGVTPPLSCDLRSGMPSVYNQSDLGSCTANAIAGVAQYMEMKEKKKDQATPSRLFIYYNERRLEGTVNSDAGAEIRDGMKTLNIWGYPDEALWPYDINKFTVIPTKSVYRAASPESKLIRYLSVSQDLLSIKYAVAGGMPVVFGFTVYPEMESSKVARTGILPMPGKNEDPIGGHAVVIVGYYDSEQMFVIRNSWGTGWGLNGSGYFLMPYAYVLSNQLASDFWVIQKV